MLPGLAIAAIVGLAGGVSLGPENPIMAINSALMVALGARLVRSKAKPFGPQLWTGLAISGTVGALFGTPVAAALLLSELSPGDPRKPLWDRLFAPLVAAGAGSITTAALAGPDMSISVPPYSEIQLVDLVSGPLVACMGAVIGMIAVYVFPLAHKAFHALRHPMAMLVAGGLALGILGMIGGRISLFKGVDEMATLASTSQKYTALALFGLVFLKLLAVVVASGSGFRGGRIFPSVFAGVALGFAVNAAVPTVPIALAVACGSLGMLLAVTRQGWLSIFTAAVIVPEMRLLPLLCIAILPAWLIVTGRPEMVVREAKASEA